MGTKGENSEVQEKPEEKNNRMVEMRTSNVEAESNRSSERRILIDNSCDGKTRLKILCAGPYSGAWSKGVYIADYISSNGTINGDSNNGTVIGASYSEKQLYDKLGKRILIQIWNLAEQERSFLVYTIVSRSADGGIVLWGPAMDTIECVLDYKKQITQKKPDLPVILIVDNVFETPKVWMGHGLPINSPKEMDNFCLANGFFAWFEMQKRACGENSVFGCAMATLINEIISRNKPPETETGSTITAKKPKRSCVCS